MKFGKKKNKNSDAFTFTKNVVYNDLYEPDDTQQSNPLFNEDYQDNDSLAGSSFTNEEDVVTPQTNDTSNKLQDDITENAMDQISEVQHMGSSSTNIAGLPTYEAFLGMAGLSSDHKKLTKHKQAKQVLDSLAAYHNKMDNYTFNMNAKTEFDSHREIVATLDDVITACRKMVDGYGFFNKRSSTYSALMPAVTQMLSYAYTLMPFVAGLNKVTTEYVFETGNNTFTFTDLVNSNHRQRLMGNIGNDGGFLRDMGGEVMKRYDNNNTKNSLASGDLEKLAGMSGGTEGASIDYRSFPTVGENQFEQKLRNLLTAMDDVSTKSSDLRSSSHTKNVYLMEFISNVVNNNTVMDLLQSDSNTNTTPSGEDLALADRMRAMSGMSIPHARIELLRIADSKNYDFGKKAEDKGAALSHAILDPDRKKAFRSVKNTDVTKEKEQEQQREAFNGGYDVAVAKVSQLLNFNTGVAANAEMATFNDAAGDKNYGSAMDLVGEDDATKLNKNDENNPKIIQGFMELQALDFIVGHEDRHANNIRFDRNAPAGKPTLMGIDNDMVFGKGPTFGRKQNEAHAENEMLGFRNFEEGNTGTINAYGTVQANIRHLDVVGNIDAFKYITSGVKAGIEQLNPDDVDKVLRPYVNRVARLAAVERVRALKKYVASSSEIINLVDDKGNINEESMGILKEKATNDLTEAFFQGNESDAPINADGKGLMIFGFGRAMRATGGLVSQFLATNMMSEALGNKATSKQKKATCNEIIKRSKYSKKEMIYMALGNADVISYSNNLKTLGLASTGDRNKDLQAMISKLEEKGDLENFDISAI